ncbi:MAG: tRNA (adenosine(37)-N6)-threonylcarbamoyltransferase complex dimerization subunit type 1 TsaB [Treponema sp.]|jgi:tRNA threonylcarbamoyladenosine biosynthesis protein TsaB|nr:tRNA (adenosine(37)-N6)-threonylcarbamoyltransferase complex dimerization subunit type 1 TsaB [Treponema sp.]
MNILAIDTAGSILSVAVEKSEEILYAETEAGVKHSGIVMDCIDSLMKKASLSPGDLDGVVCMKGPGSFTGLRIGFSIVKGLALSLSIPFAAVPTLDCIAWQYRSGLTLAAIEATRKSAWFFALYRNGELLSPTADADASQIAAKIENLIESINDKTQTITLTGSGSPSLLASLPQKIKDNITPAFENHGYARELIYIAKKEKLLENNSETLLYSGPEYIRKTDAELNLNAAPKN